MKLSVEFCLTECRYTERRYAERHYAERHGAIKNVLSIASRKLFPLMK